MGLKGINIGSLDEKVAITQRTKTGVNSANEPVYTNSTLATVSAKIMTKPGREGYEAHQQVASSVQTFLIRYRNDVDSTMWLVWDGENWFINSIEKVGRRSHLLLTAAKRDNQ